MSLVGQEERHRKAVVVDLGRERIAETRYHEGRGACDGSRQDQGAGHL